MNNCLSVQQLRSPLAKPIIGLNLSSFNALNSLAVTLRHYSLRLIQCLDLFVTRKAAHAFKKLNLTCCLMTAFRILTLWASRLLNAKRARFALDLWPRVFASKCNLAQAGSVSFSGLKALQDF